MSAKFFALLTVIGANKLAKATALGTTLKITQMAVGDGGGTLPTPDTQQTKLVGEKRRAGLNTLFVDPKNDSQIIAEQVIPENEGGYWIREIGLFDDEGSLIAVGNCPETYKPQLQEGSGRTQTIRMILTVSHTESVELKVDPSVILATREFVNDAIESASKEILKAVEETYATKEDVKKKFNIDNVVHEKGASKEKVISQFGATEIFQPKGTYPTKAEMTQELNKKVDKSSISQQLANDVSKVPSLDLLAKELGKKQGIGNYQPAGNYALKTDLNNYQPKGNYAPAGNYVTMASMNLELNKKIDKSSISQQMGNDVNKVPSLDLMAKELGKKQPAGSYVPNTRKVNGKVLNTDIALNATDIGAYSISQSNSKFQLKNTANKGERGWWKCSHTGIIFQWGKWRNPHKRNDIGGNDGIPIARNITETFPISFPNICTIIIPTVTNSDTRDNINSPKITVHSFSKTQFIFQVGEHWSIVQNSFIYWFAMGY